MAVGRGVLVGMGVLVAVAVGAGAGVSVGATVALGNGAVGLEGAAGAEQADRHKTSRIVNRKCLFMFPSKQANEWIHCARSALKLAGRKKPKHKRQREDILF